MISFIIQNMSEWPKKITGNKGYYRETHLSFRFDFNGKIISKKFGAISAYGQFTPPNLMEILKKLITKKVFVEPLAQAAIDLARKPVNSEADFT